MIFNGKSMIFIIFKYKYNSTNLIYLGQTYEQHLTFVKIWRDNDIINNFLKNHDTRFLQLIFDEKYDIKQIFEMIVELSIKNNFPFRKTNAENLFAINNSDDLRALLLTYDITFVDHFFNACDYINMDDNTIIQTDPLNIQI